MARSLHRARTVIEATLLERLEALAGAIIARMPEAGYLLVNKLTSAKVLPSARLLGDVITIGSHVAPEAEASAALELQNAAHV